MKCVAEYKQTDTHRARTHTRISFALPLALTFNSTFVVKHKHLDSIQLSTIKHQDKYTFGMEMKMKMKIHLVCEAESK